MQEKTCTQCGKAKPVSDFHVRKASLDGYRPNCKVCKRAVDAAHYASNKEKIVERVKQWSAQNEGKRKEIEKRYRKTHRQAQNLRTLNYRARKASASDGWDLTEEWWSFRKAQFGYCCAYCGKFGRLTVEHVLPLNRGGRHAPENLVPACPTCNYSKADKTVEEVGWVLRDPKPVPQEYGDVEVVPLAANKKGVTTKLAIFEDEWVSKRDLVTAMLRWRSKQFRGQVLNASECVLVSDIGSPQEFFERNHLDGNTKAIRYWGLEYGGKLVSVLSVRKNFNGEMEIARFATDYDYNVRGAAGRLVKAAKAWVGGPLYTFSNNRVGTGAVYQKLGFRLVQENPPSYYYTDGVKRYWRWQGRKDAASGMTEAEQAESGWLGEKLTGKKVKMAKVYDYGHRKWVLE